MLLNNILQNLPEYARDSKLNYSSLINNHNLLNEEQFYGTVLATIIASRNQDLIAITLNEINSYLNESTINAVFGATTIMSMTNIYYRFTELIDNKEYTKMHAGLRMNIIREHGVNKTDFELWSLAVSIINGCSMCINAHEQQLIKHEINKETIQFIAKIAAIIHSITIAYEIMQSKPKIN